MKIKKSLGVDQSVDLLEKSAIQDQADAWFMVYQHLSEKVPNFVDLHDTGIGCAIAAIDVLANTKKQRDNLLAAAKITVGDLMDSYRTHGTEWFLDATRDLRNAIAEIEASK